MTFWCFAGVCLLGAPRCWTRESHVNLHFSCIDHSHSRSKKHQMRFFYIFALVAGNEIWRPIIKLSDHRWTLLLFKVEESTFWICITSVCVIRGIVWHGCFCRFLSKIATTDLYIVQWRHWTSGCNRDKMKFEIKGNISDKIQSPAVKKDIMSSFTKFQPIWFLVEWFLSQHTQSTAALFPNIDLCFPRKLL